MKTGSLLAGQTLLVIGGSSGIGLEAARRGRGEGAAIIITARDPERVHRAGIDLGASIAAFDATDFERLRRFFDEVPSPIDHILVTGPPGGDGPLVDHDVAAARAELDAHLVLPLQVARTARTAVRSAGTLTFVGCIDAGRSADGQTLISAITAALSVITKGLAYELAPTRVNLIAARSLDPADVAELALHLMTDTAVTGATLDIDGRPTADPDGES